MTVTLGRIFGVSAAAVALTVLGFTAQAQMKKEDAAKKPPPPPACSKLKDAAACKARADCVWSDEVGKVTKKAACKAKPKPKPEKKK